MLSNLTPKQLEQFQTLLATQDVRAIGEFIGGVIREKLKLENYLDVALAQQDGMGPFTLPSEAKGRKAMRVVRGQNLETFTVTGRKVYLAPERYASRPSMDVGDLEDGNVAAAADLLNISRQALEDMFLEDGYSAVRGATKHGDTNFITVVDTGAVQADGSPSYIPTVRRKIDEIINTVADSTTSRKVRGIVARKVLAADLIVHGGLTDESKAKLELSAEVVPGGYRGIPIASVSGAKTEDGKIIFPSNEIYVAAEGAGAYAINKDIRVTPLEQRDLEVAWELWMERTIAVWYPELIWRIYVINQTAGNFTKLVNGDANSMTLTTDKYVDVATITATSLKVYSGVDPGAGAGAAFAADGVSVSADGKTVSVNFNAALGAGTYKVYNTTAVEDIGSTAFTATTDGAPIGTFTV